MGILWMILATRRGFFTSRAALVAENLALRQQLGVLQRSVRQPKLRMRDRIFWAWLLRLWSGWRSVLLIVQADKTRHIECYGAYIAPTRQ